MPSTTSERWICPTCRTGYPVDQQRCPKDGAELMPYSRFVAMQRSAEETRMRSCPLCKGTYPSNVAFCPTDGSALVTREEKNVGD
jgi:RNA polymerase subunit RPABC4/transcription elongation factor Spt4